ncbi:MAG: acyl-CoA dehydrogenase family protein [Deltaproteobacteria bacterium]|nr:acyl-CoA dehydrogenase family protein [Deltaproteobacteria bacterium]MBW2444291.1 acyl-CoA dehydrogenase family protein [Deltaproteobacteria bacterium]
MSEISADAWVARARELTPRFAERAQTVDRERRPDDASIRELEDSGLLSLLAPRTRGGAEVGLATFCDVVEALGEGCTSTAWVASFYMVHTWMAALFPAEAQDELFAEKPWVLAPAALSPTGKARLEPDGSYVVSGRWPWGTGVAHAEWMMVTAMLETEGHAPDPRNFVLPISQVEVLDNWYTDGMRGTASHDVVVESARVPAHRAVRQKQLALGTTPGRAIHPGPLYALPLPPFLALVAALPAVGTARAAVAHFRERMRERVLYQSTTKQQEKPAAQMRLARADVDVRAASLLLRDQAARLEAGAASGEPFSLEERVALRMNSARAVELSRLAVRSICEAAGARAHFEASPLQRMLRDLETLSGHVIFDGDAAAELAGRVMLGMDPNSTLL